MKQINGKRGRANFTLSAKALNILSTASKQNGDSMSSILDALILKYLTDPIKILKEQKKDHAKKIYEINRRIEDLEEK